MFALNALAATDIPGTDAAAEAAALGIFGAFAFVWVIFFLIYAGFFIWWIVLLVDVLKRDFPERTTWIIVLVVGWLVGFVWLVDLLYYFMVVRKLKKDGGEPNKPTDKPSEPQPPAGSPPPSTQ